MNAKAMVGLVLASAMMVTPVFATTSTTSTAVAKKTNVSVPMSEQPVFVKKAWDYFKKQQAADKQMLVLNKNIHHNYKYSFSDGSSLTLTTDSITTLRGNSKNVTQNLDGTFNVAKSNAIQPSWTTGDYLTSTNSATATNSFAGSQYTLTTYGTFDYQYNTPNSFTSVTHYKPGTFTAGPGWNVGTISPYIQNPDTADSALVGDQANFAYVIMGFTEYSKNQQIELICDDLGNQTAWCN